MNSKQCLKKIIILSASLLMSLPTLAADTFNAGDYKIDSDHTNIGFSVSHLGISWVVGRFNNFEGNFTFVPNGESKVQITIDTASVDTANAKRDRHLSTDDFLNVNKFPKMIFESDRVEYDAVGNPNKIIGRLTLHGTTNTVTLDVLPVGEGKGPLGEHRVGFQAKTTIQRADYGMTSLLVAASNEVNLLLNVEGIRR